MNADTYIKRHEGLRYKPYLCTAKLLTIGYGRCLERQGINREEAELMFRNDMERSEIAVRDMVPNYDRLCEPRKAVLLDMCFQMGPVGFGKFINMVSSVRREDFQSAGDHILDSLYATQTPERAKRNADQMRTGEWQVS